MERAIRVGTDEASFFSSCSLRFYPSSHLHDLHVCSHIYRSMLSFFPYSPAYLQFYTTHSSYDQAFADSYACLRITVCMQRFCYIFADLITLTRIEIQLHNPPLTFVDSFYNNNGPTEERAGGDRTEGKRGRIGHQQRLKIACTDRVFSSLTR